jgi:NAD-dependent dihydropyrimidine dehydrogenase PreA subunit
MRRDNGEGEVCVLRRIIKIEQSLCDCCELCVEACHEGAIEIRNGKAVLIRDDYCDGLGNCLPLCPTGAITFEEREAAAFDEEGVRAHLAATAGQASNTQQVQNENTRACDCHSGEVKTIGQDASETSSQDTTCCEEKAGYLAQWPVQIKLVPVNAAFFDETDLLIAADCCAYAFGDFHARFMKGRITLIGCPKLDEGDYSAKFTEILRLNTVKSVTVARMEVPCCGGLETAVINAIQNSGKAISFARAVISTNCR